MKKFSQCDQSGYFVGLVELDESPLEPGIYLVPAGAIDAAPPSLEIDEVARWNGVDWDVTKQSGASAAEKTAVARDRAQMLAVRFANTIRERIAASKHYLQASRWPIQVASAQAVKAGAATDFDTATLAREARLRGRGETVDQLADKVLGNSLIFASVGAAIDGIETATMDKIAAYNGTDPAAFDAILADAKATALAEFLDIFTPFFGADAARSKAAEFFGPADPPVA